MSDPTNNELWDDDSIQFPRFIFELYGVLEDEQVERVAASMDLRVEDVIELFNRASRAWEAEQELQRQLRIIRCPSCGESVSYTGEHFSKSRDRWLCKGET